MRSFTKLLLSTSLLLFFAVSTVAQSSVKFQSSSDFETYTFGNMINMNKTQVATFKDDVLQKNIEGLLDITYDGKTKLIVAKFEKNTPKTTLDRFFKEMNYTVYTIENN